MQRNNKITIDTKKNTQMYKKLRHNRENYKYRE